jgi:hypothetical protein
MTRGIEVGDTAPDFTLPSSSHRRARLPDTDSTMRLESLGIGLGHAISPAAAKSC